MIIVTTDQVPGAKIKEVFGIVEGVSVQSKSVFGDFSAEWKSMFGGKLGSYQKMIISARDISVNMMKQRAEAMGANAIIGLRYATPSTTAQGSAEVIAYGTAVFIEEGNVKVNGIAPEINKIMSESTLKKIIEPVEDRRSQDERELDKLKEDKHPDIITRKKILKLEKMIQEAKA